MVSYIRLITIVIASGVLIMALINFVSARKNMQKQSEEQMNKLKVLNEQQIYQRLTEVRLSLQNTEEFTRMAADSPIYAERFAIVGGNPSEYYTIMAFLDLFEYVFHLKGEKIIHDVVWNRWQALMETTMTIPKFRIVWEKTKHSHTNDQFKRFIDSLLTTKNNDNNNYIFLPSSDRILL
jgi:hypothetical protein